jgi:hypothetical protein
VDEPRKSTARSTGLLTVMWWKCRFPIEINAAIVLHVGRSLRRNSIACHSRVHVGSRVQRMDQVLREMEILFSGEEIRYVQAVGQNTQAAFVTKACKPITVVG